MSEKLTENVLKRLVSERNIWVATVRPLSNESTPPRPHLVPVWFVWHAQKLYICIESKSVKGRNLANNPHIALSLEDGNSVVICEGTAVSIPKPGPQPVQNLFSHKYDWNIETDHQYDLLLEITPTKWLIW